MSRAILPYVCFFGAVALAPAAPLTFYVSPAGNDAWSGKLAAPNAARTDGPFATLAGARDGVRKTRPEGQTTGSATVQVRAGKYCLGHRVRVFQLQSFDSRGVGPATSLASIAGKGRALKRPRRPRRAEPGRTRPRRGNTENRQSRSRRRSGARDESPRGAERNSPNATTRRVVLQRQAASSGVCGVDAKECVHALHSAPRARLDLDRNDLRGAFDHEPQGRTYALDSRGPIRRRSDLGWRALSVAGDRGGTARVSAPVLSRSRFPASGCLLLTPPTQIPASARYLG